MKVRIITADMGEFGVRQAGVYYPKRKELLIAIDPRQPNWKKWLIVGKKVGMFIVAKLIHKC